MIGGGGAGLTCQVVVANNGPSNAIGAVIDTFPSSLENISWFARQIPGRPVPRTAAEISVISSICRPD